MRNIKKENLVNRVNLTKISKATVLLVLIMFILIIAPACKEGLPIGEITETTTEAIRSETINSVPEVSDLKILPDNPNTSQDLTLSYEFNDPDDDPDKSIIKWYENDTYINDLDNTLVIPKIYLDPDDIWYAAISPYDGKNYGEDLTSEKVIVSKGNINPTIIGNIVWTNKSFQDFVIKGNYLYVKYSVYDENWNTEESIIQIMDITDKNNPKITGNLALESIDFGKMFIRGNYAYIECSVLDENWNYTDIGIRIIDLSSKENPKLIDTIKFEEEIYGFYVNEQGDDIYVLDNMYNLNIFSLDEDNRFTINNKIRLPIRKSSRELYILENYAIVPYMQDDYYSIYNAGIQIVDIAEDKNTRVISDIDLPGQFMANIRFLDSNYLILGEDKSIHIFDISNKNNPKDLNKIEIPSYSSYIKDDILYTCKKDSAYDQLYAKGEFTKEEFDNIIPNNDSYIQIIDLKIKENPELLCSIDTKNISNPSSFFKEDNYLYCYYTNPNDYGSDGILIIKLY